MLLLPTAATAYLYAGGSFYFTMALYVFRRPVELLLEFLSVAALLLLVVT